MNTLQPLLVHCCFCILFLIPSTSLPPDSPFKCMRHDISSSCTVLNAYGTWGDRIPCNISAVLFPFRESYDLLFTKYPVVGFQHRMQTSGSCYRSPSWDVVDACPWDFRFKGLFFYESTAIFSLSTIKAFISDVKKLRDMEPQGLCGVELYNGFLMRFVKGSKAYLGQPEDSVVIDFNYYRADDASSPRLNEDVWEEVEQMAFFKHGARPHWAKNRNLAFLGANAKYPDLAKFLQAMKKYDPEGLFSSDWTDQILKGKPDGNKLEGCAPEGLCICEEDRHCAAADGYFCRPGKVYPEARVCTYQKSFKGNRDESFEITTRQ